MDVHSFSAADLFTWLTTGEDFLLLDVRNDEEYGRFKVEGPCPIDMVNVPYMEFIEHEEESVAKVPRGKKLRIVCAKEGSSKFVGEILVKHGFEDVGHMLVGINAWGNFLAPGIVEENSDYRLVQFRRPGKASCSYGLIHEKEMMVFDPARNIAAYTEYADENNCVITRSFETHRQADYISGSELLHRNHDVEIMAPEGDFKEARFPYTPVRDGEVVSFNGGGPEVRIIHTPGHTPGSTSYLINGRYLISGDTVFIYSIGRPDLGGMVEEWAKMLFATMTNKLLTMDEERIILPGHYMDWKEANADLLFAESFGKIKEINSEIYTITDENAFVDFIKSNMRPQPEEYAKIREINAGLEEVDEQNANILDLGKNECAASAMGHGPS